MVSSLFTFYFHGLPECSLDLCKFYYSSFSFLSNFSTYTFKYHVFAPMGRLLPSNSRLFLSCSQETEVTSTPTRPVENVIRTKGLQDRNNLLLDGRSVENKGKLIFLSSS